MKKYPVNYLFISFLLTSSVLLFSNDAQAENLSKSSSKTNQLSEINSPTDFLNPLLLNYLFSQLSTDHYYSPKIITTYSNLIIDAFTRPIPHKSPIDYELRTGLSPPRS